MRFEEQVTLLCAQALATHDEAEVQRILAEVRIILHQHIEHLRSGLLAAYSKSLILSGSPTASKSGAIPPPVPSITADVEDMPPRTWWQVIHEMSYEQDHTRALRLSQELATILRPSVEGGGQR